MILFLGVLAGVIWWQAQRPAPPVSVPLLEQERATAALPTEQRTATEAVEPDEPPSPTPISTVSQDIPIPPTLDLHLLAVAITDELDARPVHPALRGIDARLEGIEQHLAALTHASEQANPFEPLRTGLAEVRKRIERLTAKLSAPKAQPARLPFSVVSTGRLGNIPFVVVDAGRPLQVSVGETLVGWTLETVDAGTGEWAFRKGAHRRTGRVER
ncbi:hypothetical protein [Endothiovibrio diazotrophicus]